MTFVATPLLLPMESLAFPSALYQLTMPLGESPGRRDGRAGIRGIIQGVDAATAVDRDRRVPCDIAAHAERIVPCSPIQSQRCARPDSVDGERAPLIGSLRVMRPIP